MASGGDLGRRYAAVSGDRNPIHMHSLSAKALGFPGAIAHGMWTKARCLAALESRLPDAFTVEVRFRRPIVLPARVEFGSAAEGEEIRFVVREPKRAHATPRRARRPRSKKQRAEGRHVRGAPTSVAERSMGLGLRALNRLAGSELLDRIGLRKQVERSSSRASKNGFRTATAAGRTFKAAQQARPPGAPGAGEPKGLFDLTPDDEQQMLQEAVRDFAEEKVRPAALDADAACATPAELLAQAASSASTCSASPRSSAG